MIILKIQGGLGNQMFQYAAGRNLSISLNTEIKLDITSYNNDLNGSMNLNISELKIFMQMNLKFNHGECLKSFTIDIEKEFFGICLLLIQNTLGKKKLILILDFLINNN